MSSPSILSPLHREAASWLQSFEVTLRAVIESRNWTELAHSFVQLGTGEVLPLPEGRQEYFNNWQTWPEDDLALENEVLAWLALNQEGYNRHVRNLLGRFPEVRMNLRRVLRRDQKTSSSFEGYGRIALHTYGEWLLRAQLV